MGLPFSSSPAKALPIRFTVQPPPRAESGLAPRPIPRLMRSSVWRRVRFPGSSGVRSGAASDSRLVRSSVWRRIRFSDSCGVWSGGTFDSPACAESGLATRPIPGSRGVRSGVAPDSPAHRSPAPVGQSPESRLFCVPVSVRVLLKGFLHFFLPSKRRWGLR